MQELVAILLAMLLSMTGIAREVDPVLEADAQRRVIEIQSNWSHDGMAFTEVLAFNSGFSDPVAQAVNQWRNSPEHALIVFDPSFTRLGCAIDETDGTWYFACSFDKGEAPVKQVVQVPRVEPVVPAVLPNTAMEGG